MMRLANQKHWRWNRLYNGWFSWTILAKMASETREKLLGLNTSTRSCRRASGYRGIVVIIPRDSVPEIILMDSEEEDAAAYAEACWKMPVEEFRVERGLMLGETIWEGRFDSTLPLQWFPSSSSRSEGAFWGVTWSSMDSWQASRRAEATAWLSGEDSCWTSMFLSVGLGHVRSRRRSIVLEESGLVTTASVVPNP